MTPVVRSGLGLLVRAVGQFADMASNLAMAWKATRPGHVGRERLSIYSSHGAELSAQSPLWINAMLSETVDLEAMVRRAAAPCTMRCVFSDSGGQFPIVTRLYVGAETAAECANELVTAAMDWEIPPGKPEVLQEVLAEIIGRTQQHASASIGKRGDWVIAASIADGEPLADAQLLRMHKKPFISVARYGISHSEARRHVPLAIYKAARPIPRGKMPAHAVRRWGMAIKQRHLSEQGRVTWLDVMHIFGVFWRSKADDSPPTDREMGITGGGSEAKVSATVALVALYFKMRPSEGNGANGSIGLSEVYMTFHRGNGRPYTYSEIDTTAQVDMLLTPHRRRTFEEAKLLAEVH